LSDKNTYGSIFIIIITVSNDIITFMFIYIYIKEYIIGADNDHNV